MKIPVIGLAVAGFLLLAGTAAATNSRPELEQVMADLLAWLPGEYSTQPQLFLERTLGEMPEGGHEDWYRTFAVIDAPHIGPHVIYGELRVGGPDGPLIPGQQILYIVSIDAENRAVHVSGRRIGDGARFERAHLRPELWRELAIDPRTGGNCPFRWRRHGAQLRGILNDDGKCEIVSKLSGLRMSFDAEWILNPEELWVFDNNYVEGQGLFMGREDRTHTRMYKARRFRCSGAGAGLERREFELHDRGGRATIGRDSQGRALEVELFRGAAPVGDPVRLEQQMWLALHRQGIAEPLVRRLAASGAESIALPAGAEVRVSCRQVRSPARGRP